METPRVSDCTPTPARFPVVLCALVVVGALLRIPGLFTDFWLDEVWSWTLVWNWDGTSRVSGPLGVFTEVHQDNNNHLVTLWLWASGPNAALWWYRLPGFLAGSLLIYSGGMLAARWFPARRLAAMGTTAALLALAMMPTVYASEARGYTLAACAAICSQLVLGHVLERPGAGPVALFAICSSVGFLSHLTYLPVFVTQGVWSLAVWQRMGRPVVSRLSVVSPLSGAILTGFGLPTLLVGWLWWVDLSRTNVGGGPLLSRWGTARDALAMLFGADLPEPVRTIAALITLALLTGGVWLACIARRKGTGSTEWLTPAALLFVAPAILFGLAPEGLVYPRHFLVPLVLLAPLMGGALAELWASQWGRMAGAVVAVLFVSANTLELIPFFRDGRGHWTALLKQVESVAPEGTVLIGGDHDFRDGLMVEFYRARSSGQSRIRYVPQPAWGPLPPSWLILHALEREAEFPANLATPGATWTLRGATSSGGPTGFAWGVYSRDNGGVSPDANRD